MFFENIINSTRFQNFHFAMINVISVLKCQNIVKLIS